MLHFKPSEFRVIAILTLLAVAGSVLVIIQRYEKAARFNISLSNNHNGYKYHYSAGELNSGVSLADTAARARLADLNSLSDTDKININSCGYYDFEALPGIGPALAENIISYRDSIGRFNSVDQLTGVKGIGPAKLARIRGMVEVK